MAKRFNIPFATTGDKTEIPDEVQPDGSVSYAQGFGIDYEREYTDPLSKDIAREVMNQVLSDVTVALSEIQNNGVAPFSEDSKPYPQWAIVNHPTGAYISRIDNNNNDIPHSSWMQLGGTGNNDIRTNSENDERFAQLDSDNSYTGEQHYRREGGELISSFASYGAESGGMQYVLALSAVDELPSGWPDFSISGQPDPHILRLRRSGPPGAQNVRGLAVGANDATPDIGVADGFGVVCGNPDGGFMGNGSINAEAIYVNGHLPGLILQEVVATSTEQDSTTSQTFQNTSLSASITPLRSNSVIEAIAFVPVANAQRGSGSQNLRQGSFRLRNATDDATLGTSRFGRDLVEDSSESAPSYAPVIVMGRFTVNSTAERTIRLQFSSGQSGTRVIAVGGAAGSPLTLRLREIAQ